MNTLPPPTLPTEIPVVPTSEPPSHGKYIALVIVLVVGICGIGAAIYAVVKPSTPVLHGTSAAVLFTPEPTIVNVQYSMTVNGETCSDVRTGFGYDDIPNAEVEVFDGSQHLLGFGTLDSGSSSVSPGDCYFFASFTVPVSTDDLYRVTVGNNNRGFLNYTKGDIHGGMLDVEASLGQ